MKNSDNKEELKKYFLFAIIFLLLFLSYKIIQPYMIVIISAFILSYLIHPIFIRLNKKLNTSLSAIISIIIILIVVLLPISGIIGGVINQTKNLINNPDFVEFIKNIESFPILKTLNINLDTFLEKVAFFLITLLSNAFKYIPSFILSLLVLTFGIYYILTNYETLAIELKKYIPFDEKDNVVKEIDLSTKAIIYGSFFIAIIEFIVASIGFYFFGVNSYLLFPLLIFFFAFIPGIGPIVVWIPLAIYYAFLNNWFTMMGVIFIGLILTLLIDGLLKIKILGNKAKINPFIMLIGILGGIAFFGIFGFVIGPLILIYSLKILKEYFNN